MSNKIPQNLLECLGADIFTINNKHYLCVLDYCNKVPAVKQVGGFCKDNLIKTCKVIFTECGLPCKIVSDVSTNFISEKVEKLNEKLCIEHALTSSQNHQSNGQTEA